MKKYSFVCLLLCLCLALCACAKEQETAAVPETTVAETTVETFVETTGETTESPTEAATVPTTQPPRVIGPERIDGHSVAVGEVSVTYLNELPGSVRSSSAYSACGFKEEFVLNDSQLYAEVRFTVTNKTAKEIQISDINDDFLVELIYDNRYVYSSDSASWCFFQGGAQSAVVSNSLSVGKVTLAPLATMEAQVYIPCAREVSEEMDKYLIVVFTSNYDGYENLEFIIR